MKHITIEKLDKNFEWTWYENSVLNNPSSYTAPKDIFDAVCFEISRYYSNRESFKTLKRKIRWTGQFLNCELAFFSSSHNTAGDYVAFEIVCNGYANDPEGMAKKGLLYTWIRPKNDINVYNINQNKFMDIIGYIDACVEFFKRLDSGDGFKRFIEENGCNEENNMIFLEKIMSMKLDEADAYAEATTKRMTHEEVFGKLKKL